MPTFCRSGIAVLEETFGDVWEGGQMLRICKKEDAAGSLFSIDGNQTIE